MSINLSKSTELFINEIKDYIFKADQNIKFDKIFSIINYQTDEAWSGMDRRTIVDEQLTKFYERFLSIIPANPNNKNVIEAINSLTEENDIYTTICNIIDEFVKGSNNETPIHLIEAERGNGKSTAQNYFIVNNLLDIENEKNIVIRCDVHKVWNILHHQSNGNDFTIGIERYLLLQAVYIIIKYSSVREIYKTILDDLNDAPIKTSKGYVDLPDCSFSRLVELIKDDIQKESNPQYNLLQNSAMMDLLKKACSEDIEESKLAQKKIEDWVKIGNKIYEYLAKNGFRLINFIDGIDNMYWFAKSQKPRMYFSVLIKSLVRMVENYCGGTKYLKRSFLVFIRPETTAYITALFPHGNAINRRAHEPHIYKCKNSDFTDIIKKKILLIDQEISYFELLKKEAGEAFDSLHYLYSGQSNKRNSDISTDEINCWTTINKRRFKVLEDINWTGQIKSFLKNIGEMVGPTEHLSDRPVYKYKEKTALEDMSNNNLRSISFNMIRCSSYILRYFPELINKTQYAIKYGQSVNLDRDFFNARERIVRRTLLTLGSHDYQTMRDADKSASFIPNIFWYSPPELDNYAQGNEKKVWYGLTGLRVIQVIRYNGSIRRKMAVETVHELFSIPKQVVTASFDYLLALGMIEQTEISTFEDKTVSTYSITKKCDIVERIIFNNPDTLFLLALDTPLLEGESRIKYKFKYEQFYGFLYSMISGYILMMSYMIKQNHLDMKKLREMSKKENITVAKYGTNPEETFDISKKIITEPALCSIAGAYDSITARDLGTRKLKSRLANFGGSLTTFP